MPKHHHYLLNKPHSTLSQFTHQHPTRRNKKMLGPLHDFAEGTMAIGRLDEHSEGLLLLTTDGKLSSAISSGKVEKEYYARVLGRVSDAALEQLSSGVEISLGGGKKHLTKNCIVKRLPQDPRFSFSPRRQHQMSHGPATWVSITLREGKYRQIRKMLAGVGHPVIRLVRVRIGRLRLGDLGAGEVVEVPELVV